MTTRVAARLTLLLGAIPLLGFALTALSMQHFLIDDSFISFRYARNLVEGHGLVFNPGERVEGYTNFLWVLGIATGLYAGAAAEETAVGLGVACAMLALLATYGLCAGLTARRWRFLAPALLGFSSPFAFWTFSGLETVAFMAAITCGACALTRSLDLPSVAASAVALSLACLIRPDGALFLGVTMLTLLVVSPEHRVRRIAIALAVAAAVLLPYLLWKWSYYGELVPNTFYAKVGGRLAQAVRGLRYTGNFLIYASAAGLLPAALLGVAGIEWRRIYLAALVLVQIAYVVAVGGDSFLFYRFLVPVLPLLCVLAALGFERMHEMMTAHSGSSPRWIVAGAVVLVLAVSAGYAQQGHYRDAIRDKASINVRYQKIGEWLREHSHPSDPIAVIAAGIIPYYSERPTIDMLGITDRTIGRRSIGSMGSGMPGHEKGDGRYVLSRRPRYVLIHPITTSSPAVKDRLGVQSRRFVSTRELWELPEFHQRYELRSVPIDDFYFNYFERKPETLP